MNASKTVIITGANSGLGFECARSIANADKSWHIVLACRNIKNGEEAKQKLIELTGHVDFSAMELDLASLQSVRRFADRFATAGLPPLRGIVNNAGVQVLRGLKFTPDGYELTFGTNHLGHFLLTQLLLDSIAPPARIVVVASGTHDPDANEGKRNKALFLGAKKLAKPENEKEMSGMQRYTTSKLANVSFTYELARRVRDRNITVNAFDPIAVPATNMLRSLNPVLRWLITSTGFLGLLGVETSTPERSGGAMARLLLDEALEGVTGKYFRILEEKSSSKQSYDTKLAQELWNDSLELTGLR
jgi:NAD(P)-dependent dehydrogenase (short-subunit alcohol dehydrogenase family)